MSRVALVALLAAFEFTLFEAGLRLRAGSEAAPAFQKLFTSDPVLGYRLKPGARTRFKTAEFDTEIAINGAGVRDDEIGPKAPDERRIVVVGDSLVMAVQVPASQTFCRLLQDRLNLEPAARPYRYRVINAGVQGYGPVQEYLFYQHVASRLEADVVLFALFVANDATEAADAASALGETWAALPEKGSAPIAGLQREPWAPLWARRLVRRSMVLQVVRLRTLGIRERLGDTRGLGLERPLAVYLPQEAPDIHRGLAVTREVVRRTAANAASRGAATAVVLLPARFQVNDADFDRLRSTATAYGQTLVRNLATARFREALRDTGVPLFDALPTLSSVPNRRETFFEDTVHFTPRGHQVMADALLRFVIDTGLIPSAPKAHRRSETPPEGGATEPGRAEGR